MSEAWQSAWSQAAAYWEGVWQTRGRGPHLAAPVGLALLFLAWMVANPSVAPFVFYRTEPVSDPAVLHLYRAEVQQLLWHFGFAAGSGAVLALVAGLALLSPRTAGLYGRMRRALGDWAFVPLSVAILAMANMPLGGSQTLVSAISMAAALVLGVFALPLVFWGAGHAWVYRMRRGEYLALPWLWLVGLLMGEMLSAGTSWSFGTPFLGQALLAVLAAGWAYTCRGAARTYHLSGQAARASSAPPDAAPAQGAAPW